MRWYINRILSYWCWAYTGKNDSTWCITHREAVFGLVIHSIFDAWHYKVLWTCALTRLLWYVCNYMRLILYIMLHSTNLKSNCQLYFFRRFQIRSAIHSWLHSTVHSQSAWLMLWSKLCWCSQSHSRVVLATGQGNPPVVQVLTGGSVWFGSRPIQITELRCLGGVVTQTGHKPAVFWPGLSCCRASFSQTQNVGSN